jgi:hypothetical protein
MAKTPRLYTRLTRPASSLGSYNSLWLGPDHLLQVTSNGYTESYQRFDFRDIQTFLICKTQRRAGWAWFWGAVVIVFGLVLTSTLSSSEVPFVSGFFLAVALALFTWNLAAGPTCAVYLVTRVQMLRLPSLVRRRKVSRVLERLRPMIEQAQADMATPAPGAPDAPLAL